MAEYLIRYFIFVLLSITVVYAQPVTKPDSAESTQQLQDSTASELKPQLDSAVSILKRTGKFLKKKAEEL